MIPVTSLRHFYHRLRDFSSDNFHLAAAQECERRPDRLQALIAESAEHFGLYDNRHEPFREAGGGLTARRVASSHDANRLLVRLAGDGRAVVGRPDLEFDFVDCDLSPIRTTSGEYEDGRLSSGPMNSRCDVLLANRFDRLPGVGEIKASTDRNPFLAFVQMLVYAVELTTPSQRDRLIRAYPDRFSWPDAGPYIDLILLLPRFVESPKNSRFLELVESLSSQLTMAGSPFSKMVRRVVCLTTSANSSDDEPFQAAFVHEPPTVKPI